MLIKEYIYIKKPKNIVYIVTNKCKFEREGGADIFLDSERGKDKCIPKNRKSEH